MVSPPPWGEYELSCRCCVDQSLHAVGACCEHSSAPGSTSVELRWVGEIADDGLDVLVLGLSE